MADRSGNCDAFFSVWGEIVTSFSDGGHIELEVAEFCVGVHVFGVSDCGVDGTRGLGTVGGWSLIFGLVIRGVSSIHCTK